MITAWIGSILLFLLMLLYFLLFFGAPLGEFAMGGQQKILIGNSRIACGVAVLVQGIAIFVLLQLGGVFSIGLPSSIAKGLGYFFSFYLVINVFMNFISKSKKEKAVMTPISAIIAICFLITIFSA